MDGRLEYFLDLFNKKVSDKSLLGTSPRDDCSLSSAAKLKSEPSSSDKSLNLKMLVNICYKTNDIHRIIHYNNVTLYKYILIF